MCVRYVSNAIIMFLYLFVNRALLLLLFKKFSNQDFGKLMEELRVK